MRLEQIQAALRDEGLDGWLFFDHHRRDPLAYRVLQFAPGSMVTRRWFYYIPADGEPRGLVHKIEAQTLAPLPGQHSFYAGWSTLVDGLKTLLGGGRRVAMQYSPNCAVPYVAMVDAGTVELVRELYGVMAARGATGEFVVTSGRFTDEAISFASGRNGNLVDGPKLHGLIRQAKAGIDRSPAKSAAAAAPAVPPSAAPMQASSCPLRSKPMVRRAAKRGANAGSEFWGCAGYPACRGTWPIA